MSRVDVIIPCYNYGRYLPGCVDSVLTQPGVDVRVLLLDDGSADQSASVAAHLAARDSRVTFRRHATNQGHIATYNEGLQWATGEYTLLLSADDLLTPGALGRAARLLEAHPEVGLAYGRQLVFSGDGPLPAVRPAGQGGRIVPGPAFLEAVCAAGSNPVPTPTVVVRTALQRTVGGYRPELPHTGDLEMWLRLATHAAVAALDADQAYKRLHGANMQVEYVAAVLRDLEQHWAAFESFLRTCGDRVADPDRLGGLAARQIAQRAFWSASAAFDRGDPESCQRLLALATGLDATLPSRREWARLAWKRRLGPRAWGVIRPLVERLRGRPAAVPGHNGK